MRHDGLQNHTIIHLQFSSHLTNNSSFWRISKTIRQALKIPIIWKVVKSTETYFLVLISIATSVICVNCRNPVIVPAVPGLQLCGHCPCGHALLASAHWKHGDNVSIVFTFPPYLHDLGGLTAQLAEPSALKRTKLRLRSAFTRLLGKFQPRVKRRISSFSVTRWLRGFSNFLKRTQGTKVFLVKYLKKIE